MRRKHEPPPAWGESVAVVVGAACPPRAYNNNLLWLLLWLRLLLLLWLLLWLLLLLWL